MQPLAVGYNIWDPPAVADVIDRAKKTGVKRAACYAGCAGAYRFGMRNDPPSYDELMKECEQFDKAAEELGKGHRSLFPQS